MNAPRLLWPTIVTPLMLAGRLFEPTRPSLSRLACEASWREAFEELERRALAWHAAGRPPLGPEALTGAQGGAR